MDGDLQDAERRCAVHIPRCEPRRITPLDQVGVGLDEQIQSVRFAPICVGTLTAQNGSLEGATVREATPVTVVLSSR